MILYLWRLGWQPLKRTGEGQIAPPTIFLIRGSFRRLPCHFDRGYLHSLLRDSQIDSELRIASYIEVMRCPSYKLIKTVKHMLKNEEVNQGVFHKLKMLEQNKFILCSWIFHHEPLGKPEKVIHPQ